MRPANRSRERDRHQDPGSGRTPPPLTLLGDQPKKDPREIRSSYGTIPGDDLPTFVYVSVLAAYAWIMFASWPAFARDMDADLSLGIATVLGIIFFALPIIIRHVSAAFSRPKPQAQQDFLAAPVETATGPLSGASAWLQVLIIPLSLALAATLIGAASVLVR